MFPKIRFAVVLSACGMLFCSTSFAQTGISFDVPAMVRASVQSVDPITEEKTVEIKLPISIASESAYRGKIQECQFDVRWNQGAYAIEDFQPRSQTESSIQGLINVERDQTRNATLSFNLTGTPVELSSARLASDLGWGNSRHETFQQVPRQQTLVTSGTLDRATGAFFRFHSSPTEVFDGLRELSLTYRVPSDWSAGILQVDCQATGSNEIASLWKEPFEVQRSFVVPVFEDNNVAAQKLAIDFASAEQELRRAWIDFEQQMKKDSPLRHLISRQPKLFGQWPHQLIQSGDDQYFSEFRGYLTEEVAAAAETFVEARQSLSSASR